MRVEQFKIHQDETFRLCLSKAVVEGEPTNCLNFVKAFSYNHSDINFKGRITDLEASVKSIKCINTTASLLGIKGNVARVYFESFGKMVLGFNPYLGYYHEVKYGRASLTCDIQEEFRPAIDRFVLYLINRDAKQGSFLPQSRERKYISGGRSNEKYINREFRYNESGQNTTIKKCFRCKSTQLNSDK